MISENLNGYLNRISDLVSDVCADCNRKENNCTENCIFYKFCRSGIVYDEEYGWSYFKPVIYKSKARKDEVFRVKYSRNVSEFKYKLKGLFKRTHTIKNISWFGLNCNFFKITYKYKGYEINSSIYEPDLKGWSIK